MIVFGPIMFVWSLGVIFILCDIFFTKPEEPDIKIITKKQQPISWANEYEDNSTYLNDEWDENSEIV